MKASKLILLLICINVSKSTNFQKTWVPNTNFENVNNWKNKKLPCSEDRIIFPSVTPEISIGKSHIFTDMILPTNGEFKLQGDISLKFMAQSSSSDSDCAGIDAHYNRTEPKNWLNPDNWCKKKNNNCFKSVVEAEIIPNDYDTIIFPALSSYYVEIDQNIHIEVSSAEIKGKRFQSSRNLRQFLSGIDGRREFTLKGSQHTPTISLSGKQCRNSAGCVPNTLKMLTSICRYVKCSSQLSCSRTVRPKGACCDICAALMFIVPDYNFQLNTLENLLSEKVNKAQKWSLMKVSSSQLQLVLWSPNDEKMDVSAAQDLYSTLKSKLKDLNIKDIRMSSSQPIDSGRHRGATALTVILILIFLGCLFGGTIYGYQKYKTGELSLGRVEEFLHRVRSRISIFNETPNRHSRLQEPSYSASAEKRFNDDIELPSAVAFDNPIFEGITEREDKKIEDPQKLLDLDDCDTDKRSTIKIENVCSTENDV